MVCPSACKVKLCSLKFKDPTKMIQLIKLTDATQLRELMSLRNLRGLSIIYKMIPEFSDHTHYCHVLLMVRRRAIDLIGPYTDTALYAQSEMLNRIRHTLTEDVGTWRRVGMQSFAA